MRGNTRRDHEELEYPALNAHVVPVALSEDDIQFRIGPWSGPVLTVEDEEAAGQLSSLIPLLDGETSVDEILAAFDDGFEVLKLLLNLYDSGLVVNGGDRRGPVRDYAALNPRASTNDAKRLESTAVLRVGDAQMGSLVEENLAYAGVGDVAARTAPSRSTLADLLPTVDMVVYAGTASEPGLLEAINAAAIETDTPWTSARLLGLDGLVGPTIVPGETACETCFRRRMYANVPEPAYYEAYERSDGTGGPTLPAHRHLLAGALSIDVLNYLSSGFGYTVGTVVQYNLLDLSMEANQVLKLPRCPDCGGPDDNDVNRLVSVDQVIENMERE